MQNEIHTSSPFLRALGELQMCSTAAKTARGRNFIRSRHLTVYKLRNNKTIHKLRVNLLIHIIKICK